MNPPRRREPAAYSCIHIHIYTPTLYVYNTHPAPGIYVYLGIVLEVASQPVPIKPATYPSLPSAPLLPSTLSPTQHLLLKIYFVVDAFLPFNSSPT